MSFTRLILLRTGYMSRTPTIEPGLSFSLSLSLSLSLFQSFSFSSSSSLWLLFIAFQSSHHLHDKSSESNWKVDLQSDQRKSSSNENCLNLNWYCKQTWYRLASICTPTNCSFIIEQIGFFSLGYVTNIGKL